MALEEIVQAVFGIFLVAVFIGAIGPALFQISGASGAVFVVGALALIAAIIIGVLKGR